ncbi:hypothetical protein BZA77DRAFT_330665 [Pyronema omphalodes]|nr:hypothetical protein BZA77DRAFT_330665 [Pyronema omphalodes]
MEIFSLPQEEKLKLTEYPCMLMAWRVYFYRDILHYRIPYFSTHTYQRGRRKPENRYLSKRGKSNVKFTRLVRAKGKQDPTAFIITTDQRKLYFRADTVTSAKEWVKAIQKAIFRTRNEGDSVKICIPTSSKTIRLNVVDSDDTYTIDDITLVFNEYGTTALRTTRSTSEIQLSSPRVSGEYTRSSFDPARNDFGGPLKRKQAESSLTTDDEDHSQSGSQILKRSVKVGSILTSQPMGFLKKFTDMLSGGKPTNNQWDGHSVKIATHAEFRNFVESHGIEFAEHGMFTPEFLRQTHTTMRSDLLIESPSCMGGVHIAEALHIPYFRAFTMPWTRTNHPHAFAVPERKMGGAFNYLTYTVIDRFSGAQQQAKSTAGEKNMLGLRSTDLSKLQLNKVPFLYNFSPNVVSPPIDYPDWVRVTGYWFLDNEPGFIPDPKLVAFIKKARQDGKKIVYVGFGSVTVEDPVAMTRTIVESVLAAGVRCILSKGWSERGKPSSSAPNPTDTPADKIITNPHLLSPEIFQILSCPHDWLFQQIDAAVHHGGAGTTGASLRAGLPTVIKPFFGDQFFYATRVEDLGVGVALRKLNTTTTSFTKALVEVTGSERIVTRAKVLGEKIRAENGVATAIKHIYRDMDYALSLIKDKKPDLAGDLAESDESWTFVGNDLE